MASSESDSGDSFYSALTSHSRSELDSQDQPVPSTPNDTEPKPFPFERISHEIRGCRDFEEELRNIPRGSSNPAGVKSDENADCNDILLEDDPLLESQHDVPLRSDLLPILLPVQNITENDKKLEIASSETEFESQSQKQYIGDTYYDTTLSEPAESMGVGSNESVLQAVQVDSTMISYPYGGRVPAPEHPNVLDLTTEVKKPFGYSPKSQTYDLVFIETIVSVFHDETFELAPLSLVKEYQILALGSSFTWPRGKVALIGAGGGL